MYKSIAHWICFSHLKLTIVTGLIVVLLIVVNIGIFPGENGTFPETHMKIILQVLSNASSTLSITLPTLSATKDVPPDESCLPFSSRFPSVVHQRDEYRAPLQNVIVAILCNFEVNLEIMTYLTNLYRPHFKDVLWLLPSSLAEHNEGILNITDSFSMYYCNHTDGWFGYVCLGQVIDKLNITDDTKGILQISDDSVFVLEKVQKKNLQNLWYFSHLLSNVGTSYITNNQSWDYWWNMKGVGYDAFMNFVNSTDYTLRLKEIFDERFGVNRTLTGHVISDIFYLPRPYLILYSKYSQILFKYRIFLEIAVPLIFAILIAEQTLVCPACGYEDLDFHHVWGGDRWDLRKIYESYYAPESWTFYHPFKLSSHLLYGVKDCYIAIFEQMFYGIKSS